jgi:hypothetical protein
MKATASTLSKDAGVLHTHNLSFVTLAESKGGARAAAAEDTRLGDASNSGLAYPQSL